MAEIDVKRLIEQVNAAQSIIQEIRLTCGCDAIEQLENLPPERETLALQAAERAYRNRRSRKDFIGTADLFGEPAWDLLLDLFIRQTKAEQVTVKTAFMHSDASLKTVVRLLKVMEHSGLIAVTIDPDDDTRQLINLNPTGYEGMLRYLESTAR